MNNKSSSVLLIFTLAAVVIGGTAGYFMPEFMLSISFIGILFLNSLKIIAIPFAITMIIAGVASMGSKEKVKRSLGKTGLYFAATSLTASLVGVLLALGIQPGVGALKDGAHIPEEIVPHMSTFSFNDLFGSFIPENFLSASIEIQFFALILFAFLLGTVLTTVDRKNRIVLDFFLSLKEMLSGLMKFVFYAAPIGLFSLSGALFAENWHNSEMLFSSLALFTITIIFGLSFFALVLLPIIARIFSNISPYSYFTTMIPALSTAFATNSAAATLPITEECIKTTSVDQRASAFVLPLGALFNASGTALFLSAATIFIAQLYGLSISVGQILVIIGGSFFIATITAFIPYASLFMLALVLGIADFPIHVTAGIGLLVLVDFLFGRIRSVVDVWSDAIGVAVLSNTFDFKTARSAKAATPVKRTYNKTKTRTPRISKTDSPKVKRETKSDSKSKPANGRKKTKEIVKKEISSKETKSPFQISPETDYFSESDKNTDTIAKTVTKVKPEPKKQKSPVVKHEIKVPKLPQKTAKKDTQKATPKTDKAQPKQEKPKPIIHKIEVPPLPIIPKPLVVTPEVKEKQTDEDSVITKVSAILSQDTIERERAKIAAQLNLMREKESIQDYSLEEKQPETITPEVETADTEIEKQDDQFTKIDFYSDDKPVDSAKPIEAEKSVESVEPDNSSESIATLEKIEPTAAIDNPTTITDEQAEIKTDEEIIPVVEPAITEPVEEKSSISYGRKSLKRTATKQTTEETPSLEPKPEPEQEPSQEPKPESEASTVEKKEFSVENMSFGRGKRKK